MDRDERAGMRPHDGAGEEGSNHVQQYVQSSTTDQIKDWRLEGGSLLLSIICTAGVLVLLWKYDNKPLPHWYGITFNSAISYLSDVAKTALLYPVAESMSQLKWVWFWNPTKPRVMDDLETYNQASRDPFGSIAMLCKPRLW